jgi:hypothetical protein
MNCEEVRARLSEFYDGELPAILLQRSVSTSTVATVARQNSDPSAKSADCSVSNARHRLHRGIGRRLLCALTSKWAFPTSAFSAVMASMASVDGGIADRRRGDWLLGRIANIA